MPKHDVLEDEIAAKSREISSDGYSVSIGELMSMYRDGDIDLHPEFQRIFRWSAGQKSSLIESIFLGIPIPSIFVSQREDGIWDVVDGVQRLSTIMEYVGLSTTMEKRYSRSLPSPQFIFPRLRGESGTSSIKTPLDQFFSGTSKGRRSKSK